MATNPYASPESGRASATEDDAITPRMIALMGEARWWTMVLALLSLLMSLLLLLTSSRVDFGVAFGMNIFPPPQLEFLLLLMFMLFMLLLLLTSVSLLTFRKADNRMWSSE